MLNVTVFITFIQSSCFLFSGSPYIDASREEFQPDHFPIGMVFIFVVFGLVGLSALLCGISKLVERRKKREHNFKSMPTFSMIKQPNPRRELLSHTNIDYLSIATLPLFSYQMLSNVMKLKGQGRVSRDFGSAANGLDESEAAAQNVSCPLDYEEAANLDEYMTVTKTDDFCEIDLGKGEMDYVNNTLEQNNFVQVKTYPEPTNFVVKLPPNGTNVNNISPNNANPNNISHNNINPAPLRAANRDGNIIMCINAVESVV